MVVDLGSWFGNIEDQRTATLVKWVVRQLQTLSHTTMIQLWSTLKIQPRSGKGHMTAHPLMRTFGQESETFTVSGCLKTTQWRVATGKGPQAKTFEKLLCNKLAYKTKQKYKDIINYYRCKLSFLISKLILLCIRGSRKTSNRTDELSNMDDLEFYSFDGLVFILTMMIFIIYNL